jgi:hypothetical protein
MKRGYQGSEDVMSQIVPLITIMEQEELRCANGGMISLYSITMFPKCPTLANPDIRLIELITMGIMNHRIAGGRPIKNKAIIDAVTLS